MQCKTSVYFSFNLGWYSVQLDTVRLEQGDGEGVFLTNKTRLVWRKLFIIW